jgi:hypothetical protein
VVPFLGPQNLIDLHPVLQFQLKKNVTGAIAWDWYWRESTYDGIYAFGSGVLIDPAASTATPDGSPNEADVAGPQSREFTEEVPLPAIVVIGGKPAQVLYAGGAPGETAGVMQLNQVVPDGIQPGVSPYCDRCRKHAKPARRHDFGPLMLLGAKLALASIIGNFSRFSAAMPCHQGSRVRPACTPARLPRGSFPNEIASSEAERRVFIDLIGGTWLQLAVARENILPASDRAGIGEEAWGPASQSCVAGTSNPVFTTPIAPPANLFTNCSVGPTLNQTQVVSLNAHI